MPPMTPPIHFEVLEARMLALPKADRSRLMDRLIGSLDADARAEAEWDAWAEAREADIASGAQVAAPIDEVMARPQARFPL